MATDVDHSYYGWSRDEFPDRDDTEDASTAQMLDHGSVSFGRFAVEPLAWEKRSAFKHDRYQDELEKFKAPGLVAQKKAYFEEYYKKIRALKSLQQSQQNELTQQTELNLDYGNTIISSEAEEEVETSTQPQSFGGVSSALSGEEKNELGSLQKNDYGSALLIVPLDQGSIGSLSRSTELVELENNDDSACDMENELLVRKSLQETELCDVGCEITDEEVEIEAERLNLSNRDSNACSIKHDKLKLIMEMSREAGPRREVIAPVRTDSKSDPKRKPVFLKSSEGSKPQAQLVVKYAKLRDKAGSSIVLNKTSSSLSSNTRPASSYSQRSSTVSNKLSANRLPIDKRPASSYSRRPLPQLVGKDEKLSSRAGNNKVLNNPAANRLQINKIRPSPASSREPPQTSVDRYENLRRIGNNTMDQPTANNTLQTVKRPASASSQRLQLVSKNKNVSEKGGRSAVLDKPTASYSRPASAASHRSLIEERPSVTVPRPFSFATERRGFTSSARDSATQNSSREPQPSHLMVQTSSKKTAINGMQGHKAIENRNSEDMRKENSAVVKHDGDRERSAGVNHVIGTQTARSFNLPARRMPYPTVAMQKDFVKDEKYGKVLIEPKVFESTNSTSRRDKTTMCNDKKRTSLRSKDPPAGASRQLTPDSSHCRKTSRKQLPIWR